MTVPLSISLERIAAALFTCSVALLPLQVPSVPGWPFAVFPGDVALALAGAAALFARRRAAARSTWPPFVWTGLAYIVVSLTSALLSEDTPRSTLKWMLGVCHVALALFTFLNIDSLADLRRVARAWFAGTAVTVAVGCAALAAFYAGSGPDWLLATLSGYGSLPAGPYSRPGALFHQANPNSLCQYLSVSLLLLLPARRLG